jgi:hypothetical protein
MKQEMTVWKCTNPKCGHEDFHRYGGSSMTWDKDGKVHHKSYTRGCKLCGAKVEPILKVFELMVYNACG